jgi:hypothetical protein
MGSLVGSSKITLKKARLLVAQAQRTAERRVQQMVAEKPEWAKDKDFIAEQLRKNFLDNLAMITSVLGIRDVVEAEANKVMKKMARKSKKCSEKVSFWNRWLADVLAILEAKMQAKRAKADRKTRALKSKQASADRVVQDTAAVVKQYKG